ncbi:hypothetical protein CRG98_044872 [Punica granatum]|uniref:Uncharacterized protein n=1 Tax=Punica granatum TaxID=22663 RepID=A0A2I0HSQ5_PUNGR|nr:hypothetical protein CRG98_044872 [Punica granatum]
MSRSTSWSPLDCVTLLLDEITHIWTSLHPIDHDYITAFVGNIPLFATRRSTEPTPTIEKYCTLIHRRTRISLSLYRPGPAHLPGHLPLQAHRYHNQAGSSSLGDSWEGRRTHRPTSTPKGTLVLEPNFKDATKSWLERTPP